MSVLQMTTPSPTPLPLTCAVLFGASHAVPKVQSCVLEDIFKNVCHTQLSRSWLGSLLSGRLRAGVPEFWKAALAQLSVHEVHQRDLRVSMAGAACSWLSDFCTTGHPVRQCTALPKTSPSLLLTGTN